MWGWRRYGITSRCYRSPLVEKYVCLWMWEAFFAVT